MTSAEERQKIQHQAVEKILIHPSTPANFEREYYSVDTLVLDHGGVHYNTPNTAIKSELGSERVGVSLFTAWLKTVICQTN